MQHPPSTIIASASTSPFGGTATLALNNVTILNMPSNGGGSATQTVDVGNPRHPTGWSETRIRFHNFAQLPHRKGDHTDSSPFTLHGLDWYLRIHPGGAASANGDNMVSLYLRCKTAAEQNVPVQAEFSLALLRASDSQIDSMMSCPCNQFRRKRKGWPNFISRCRLLDGSSRLLDGHGTLTVVTKVQLFREQDANFVPRNGINLFRLLIEANSSFPDSRINGEVDCDGDESGSSTANTADVKFIVEGETIHAHRLILKLSAPFLAILCEGADEDMAIPIDGVRSPIFQSVLRFAYGDVVPDEVWTTEKNGAGNDSATEGALDASPALELLDAANRFGVVPLKILAETRVAAREISVSNASSLILFADSKNCALLKERATDFFVQHAEEIRREKGWKEVQESASLLDELMEALLSKRILRSFSSSNCGGEEEDDDVDYGSMGVNLLRRKLDKRRLDVDGSREMLIERLERWDGRKKSTPAEAAETITEEA